MSVTVRMKQTSGADLHNISISIVADTRCMQIFSIHSHVDTKYLHYLAAAIYETRQMVASYMCASFWNKRTQKTSSSIKKTVRCAPMSLIKAKMPRYTKQLRLFVQNFWTYNSKFVQLPQGSEFFTKRWWQKLQNPVLYSRLQKCYVNRTANLPRQFCRESAIQLKPVRILG